MLHLSLHTQRLYTWLHSTDYRLGISYYDFDTYAIPYHPSMSIISKGKIPDILPSLFHII